MAQNRSIESMRSRGPSLKDILDFEEQEIQATQKLEAKSQRRALKDLGYLALESAQTIADSPNGATADLEVALTAAYGRDSNTLTAPLVLRVEGIADAINDPKNIDRTIAFRPERNRIQGTFIGQVLEPTEELNPLNFSVEMNQDGKSWVSSMEIAVLKVKQHEVQKIGALLTLSTDKEIFSVPYANTVLDPEYPSGVKVDPIENGEFYLGIQNVIANKDSLSEIGEQVNWTIPYAVSSAGLATQ